MLNKGYHEFNALSLDEAVDRPYPFIFIGFPSAKDPSWPQRYPGRSTVTVVTFAPYRWFAQWSDQPVKKRDDEYQGAKQLIGQKIVDQVCHLFPNLKVPI